MVGKCVAKARCGIAASAAGCKSCDCPYVHREPAPGRWNREALQHTSTDGGPDRTAGEHGVRTGTEIKILKSDESCISNPKSKISNWTACRHLLSLLAATIKTARGSGSPIYDL